MKKIMLLLLGAVGLSGLFSASARAAWPAQCRWVEAAYSHEHITLNSTVPSIIKLRKAQVGSVIGVAEDYLVQEDVPVSSGVKCPYPALQKNIIKYKMLQDSPMQLENGFDNVYKTGVKGVGVKVKLLARRFVSVIPFELQEFNTGLSTTKMIQEIDYEFIQTDTIIGTGRINLNYKIGWYVNGWHAATFSPNATAGIPVEIDRYFEGCSGLKKDLNVRMSKASMGDVLSNAARAETFGLDVRCVGQPAGTKLPVKVYFEGDSPGDGRLNIRGGGASGVEISLLNNQGIALPFSKSRAMSMGWVHSDAEGEIYTLPVSARYIRKPNTPVTAGRADAVLNYVLEYK